MVSAAPEILRRALSLAAAALLGVTTFGAASASAADHEIDRSRPLTRPCQPPPDPT